MTANEILFLMMLVFPFVVIEQLIQLKDRRKMQVIPKDFIKLEDFAYKKKALVNQDFNNAGIYIFTNLDNGAKYVGQSINPINRIDNHIKGRGNPELYCDIEKGDKFAVKIIKLTDTNFDNLNDLERHYIAKYNSYYNGYNKTRGNTA